MPKPNQSDSGKNFVPRFLPWLLGGVMLVVYWLTLNHWVTLQNVGQVATVSGFVWHPQISNPLTFLVTLPFSWLPAAKVPLLLNIFSAFCGAATLAILARSVTILPHDRTEMERMRERSDFAFLTSWVAWLPPVVAVIFAGSELGFWESATSFTGDSFELLWFAFILWQLLEYRLDESEARLFLAAFLYGAGITENWAMVGFSPVFLMMLIWLRKLDFFNFNFLVRLVLCGLVGLLFLLLLPLAAKFSAFDPMPFWQTLKFNLRTDWQVVALLTRPDVRHDLALMALTTLVPALVMSIRWSSSFGDSSRLGTMLVNYTMHAVNAMLFGLLIWIMFDPPFSPRQLTQEIIQAPALTFYYVAALGIGYYSGYALLIFGKKPIPTRRNVVPDPALPRPLLWLCPIIVACTLAAIVVAASLLISKNLPAVRAINGDSLLKYAQFTEEKLPPGGAILFCDNDDLGQSQPIRVNLLQTVLARDGRAQDYPVVDTAAMKWAPYHNYLHHKYPKIWPAIVSTNGLIIVSELYQFVLLKQLSQSNNLCYLNPSFGYYFEEFYLEPHGLVYAMKPLPADTLLPPPLDQGLIDENESFWTEVLGASRPAIDHALAPHNYGTDPGAVGWLMRHLHVPVDQDPNALLAGAIYSRGLNFLGVQVQRAVELEKAGDLFNQAQELNTNNVVANINFEFNKSLRAGTPASVSLSRVATDLFGKYHGWDEVMDANGPFDETSFCFENGARLVENHLLRQATASFDRVRQLVPDNLAARLFLGRIYLSAHLPDKALEALHDPLDKPALFALNETNSTELDVLTATCYFQKNDNAAGAAVLESEMARHPNDEHLMLISAQVFNMRGLYTNALHAINRKLARTPDDLTWVYGKGIVSLQIGAYDDAVKSFSHFLELETNSPDALYNRGVAYFTSGRLDAARADFLKFQTTFTNNLQIAYGLGEIAWRQHETNEAIRNYQIIIANAPTNTPDLKTVRERLAQLGAQ